MARRPKPASALVADVPSTLDAVLERATEKNPEVRYASATEMAAAILEAIKPLRPAEPAEVIKFLRSISPTLMGELRVSAPVEAVRAEETGEQTVVEIPDKETAAAAEASDRTAQLVGKRS